VAITSPGGGPTVVDVELPRVVIAEDLVPPRAKAVGEHLNSIFAKHDPHQSDDGHRRVRAVLAQADA
jgi:hypothetical protein